MLRIFTSIFMRGIGLQFYFCTVSVWIWYQVKTGIIEWTGKCSFLFYFLEKKEKWKSLSPVWLFATPWTIQSMEFSTGVGSLSLLQGIFPTQGSNPGLPNCRQILHQLSHQGIPRILEWVAYPLSIGSCRPRNRTGVSCIAGGFLTNWAMREARFLQKIM